MPTTLLTGVLTATDGTPVADRQVLINPTVRFVSAVGDGGQVPAPVAAITNALGRIGIVSPGGGFADGVSLPVGQYELAVLGPERTFGGRISVTQEMVTAGAATLGAALEPAPAVVLPDLMAVRNATFTARDDAEAARDRAAQWAWEPENSEVAPGLFSARHYALKSSGSATAAAASATGAAGSASAASSSATTASNAAASASADAVASAGSATAASNAATDAAASAAQADALVTENGVIPLGAEILWPLARPFPDKFTDTGLRLLSGVSERAILVFFTPTTLFGAGDLGAWYDPSDLSTLYQDAAGTVPVTTDGDPVGRMLDKSPNGNHVSQAVSAKRPVYRTDGTLHWLEFDGVDDVLIALGVSMSGATTATMYVGMQTLTPISLNSPVIQFGRLTGATSTDPAIRLTTGDGSQDAYRTWLVGSANNAGQRLSITSPFRAILGATYDPAQGAAAEMTMRENGVARNVPSTTDSGVTQFGTNDLALGWTPEEANASTFFGRLYSAVLLPRLLSTEERGILENYLATKTGVTL